MAEVRSLLRTGTARARIVLLIGLLAAEAGLIHIYVSDNAFLRDRVAEAVAGVERPSELVVTLTDFVRREVPPKIEQKPFLHPLFMPLRPPPRAVVEWGGDCADKSRLLITLLRLHGVSAGKVALYDDGGVSRHAVVRADIENGATMVVDALYGMYFPRPAGGYYTVSDITADEGILKARVAQLGADGGDGFRPPVARYPFDRYTYRQPRSINWEKLFLTRWLYAGLHAVMGDDVDTITRPFWAERPALMLLFLCVGLQLFLLATWLPGMWKRRRRARGAA